MSLEIENIRPYQRKEPERIQSIISEYVPYKIKSMYPEKLNHSMIGEHVTQIVPYSCECEYQLRYRSEDRDIQWVVAPIYRPPSFKNQKKINKLEKDRYKFYKNDKITLITDNNFKKFNPLFYKNHILKPLLEYKMLQLIDKNLDTFKQWGCKNNCVKSPCFCKNRDPVTGNVCCILSS